MLNIAAAVNEVAQKVLGQKNQVSYKSSTGLSNRSSEEEMPDPELAALNEKKRGTHMDPMGDFHPLIANLGR